MNKFLEKELLETLRNKYPRAIRTLELEYGEPFSMEMIELEEYNYGDERLRAYFEWEEYEE